jgi:hypothetical protein
LSEESAVGVGPAALDNIVAPECPPEPAPSGAGFSVGVGGQLAVNHIGEAALETAQGFHRCLAGGQLAPVVGPAFVVAADLRDGHDVQHPVDPLATYEAG